MEEKIIKEGYVEELERIRLADPQRMLRVESVVATAADPNSPLHGYFEWDDDEAAHKFRLEQARHLIKRVEVYIEPLNIRVRAYASLDLDREGGNRGWRSMTDVMANRKLREQLLQTAFRELHAMENRFQHLEELAGVWKAAHRIERSGHKKRVVKLGAR